MKIKTLQKKNPTKPKHRRSFKVYKSLTYQKATRKMFSKVTKVNRSNKLHNIVS